MSDILKKLVALTAISILLTSCNKYELATYGELRMRMNSTFVGTQTGVGTGTLHDSDLSVINFGDSSMMIVGQYYDSLIVRIKSIDYSDGLVVAKGDSIDHLAYIDKDESLDIIKDVSSVPLFIFAGKRKD